MILGLSNADSGMTLDCENSRHLTVVGLHDTAPGYGNSDSDMYTAEVV